MKQAKELFNRPLLKVQTKQRSQRDEIIDNFLNRLNPGRLEAGYTPLTPSRLLGEIKRSGRSTKTEDLYIFFQECNRANHFGKFYNWSIRKNNN